MPISTQYIPVIKEISADGKLTASALVGVNSLMLGWSVSDDFDRNSLLGFGIHKTVFDENNQIRFTSWLKGNKRFAFQEVAKEYSSETSPFQRFVWNEYTLNPNFSYSYLIVPIIGNPTAPQKGSPVELNLRPAFNDDPLFGVYTNRGVSSAQAYLRDFKDTNPKDSPDAQVWLSRGLKESLIDFINQAQGGDSLHTAIYEFEDEDVAAAFKAAKERNADVHIVYHAKNQSRREKNEETLHKFELDNPINSTPRENIINISHNKFVVLLKDGIPTAVWTGTSNFTFNGFYLQTNMGLEIKHPTTANAYNQYFEILKTDPKVSGVNNLTKKDILSLIQKTDTLLQNEAWKVNFSPISNTHLLQKSCELIAEAQSAVFISAPFAMDQSMVDAMAANTSNIIEYGLVNTTAKKKIENLNFSNTRFFNPTRLETFQGKAWDAKAFGSHKIHSKTIVIDPWSDNPKLIVGTGNFSDEACTNNDENFLVIEGDKRLAAIISTEFIRMWEHYKNRSFINQLQIDPNQIETLDTTGQWSKTAYNPLSRSYKFRERIVFSGGI
ncbi:phospholipase D-like domain-containing protein [Emticicia oligotrophica]|uniref:phospholipase D-like domain-containing protein n=1 Tax=Emticicia oligotrophica TaxID=312279 RepID=UPI00273C80AD|nr:phospholipase D-like domain-containing protein [Emticicia oligotrophica]